MPTSNIKVTSNWVKVAAATDAHLLATWESPCPIEVATTLADTAPTVQGHVVLAGGAITRDILGDGYVWLRLKDEYPAEVLVVISK